MTKIKSWQISLVALIFGFLISSEKEGTFLYPIFQHEIVLFGGLALVGFVAPRSFLWTSLAVTAGSILRHIVELKLYPPPPDGFADPFFAVFIGLFQALPLCLGIVGGGALLRVIVNYLFRRFKGIK